MLLKNNLKVKREIFFNSDDLKNIKPDFNFSQVFSVNDLPHEGHLP